MGGFVLHDKNTNQDYDLGSEKIEPYLRNGRCIITKEEILDKSKGNILTKGLVVLQTSWFILQIIARVVEHLPITELEIATLAFATLNGATFALWWHKPLNVECPIIVAHLPQLMDAEVGADGSVHHEPVGDGRQVGVIHSHFEGGGDSTNTGDFDAHNPLLVDAEAGSADSLPRGTVKGSHRHQTTLSILDGDFIHRLTFAVVGALFGGIHSFAWSSHYPTAPEKLVWQISSIVTITFPILISAGWNSDDPASFAARFARKVSRLTDNTSLVTDGVAAASNILYILARVALLVLAFTTLRSLPPDAYTTVHWTTFIPHI
jgi:hypothetical protein